MESMVEPRQNEGWWTFVDEGYWQALLEQGEVAAEFTQPTDPPDEFQGLKVEIPQVTVSGSQAVEGGAAASENHGWQEAQRALEQGRLFHLAVSGANRGGLLVDWNGLQGFVPASHLRDMPLSHNPSERMQELTQYIGLDIGVRLIEVDPQQNRLVFSERASGSDLPPAAILNSLSPGDTCQGVVTNLTAFGAFIDLGGVEGLVHISELSWDRVRNPGDVLQPGQEVKVHVLGVNPDEGRVALSLKRMRPNPWLDVESRYHLGQIIEGVVTNVVSFGAFVRVEEGVEGLVHISELAEGSFLHPRNVVREGDMVRVRVLNVDSVSQRLGLSLRQANDGGTLASA
jgi:small subunit ribosomal protein S1